MTLHLTDRGPIAGTLKMVRDWIVDIPAFFDYSLSTDCLPKDFTKSEIDRCIKNGHYHLYDDENNKFSELNFDDYDEIVVWHSMDANSLLLLYYMCSCLKKDVFHCNITEFYGNKHIRPNHIMGLFSNLQVIKRRVDDNERLKYVEIYNSLLETEGIPKISDGYNIIPVSKDFVKYMLLNNITDYPRNYINVIRKTRESYPIQMSFRIDYLESLLFEMIEDKIIEPVKIDRVGNSHDIQVGNYFRKYKYNDEYINDWYMFSVKKAKFDIEDYLQKLYEQKFGYLPRW